MIIKSIEGEPLNIKLSQPFSYSKTTLSELHYVLVKLVTNENILGVGEAALAWDVTGETQGGALELIPIIQTLLKHEKVTSLDHIRTIMERISGVIYGNTGLKAAVECALLDVLGQYLNKPIYQIIGGQWKHAVTFNRTFSYEELSSYEKVTNIMQDAIKGGVQIFKLKIGQDADIKLCERLSKCFPDIRFVIDVNKGWPTRQEAIQQVQRLEKLNIGWIEQPLPADDWTGLAFLRKLSSIPIMVDESCKTLQELQFLYNNRALDLVNIKLAKCGGLLRAKEMIEFCDQKGIGYMLGDMLHSSIGTAHNLHTATLGDFITYDLTLPWRVTNDPGKGLVIIGHTAQIPSAKGLGVNLVSIKTMAQ